MCIRFRLLIKSSVKFISCTRKSGAFQLVKNLLSYLPTFPWWYCSAFLPQSCRPPWEPLDPPRPHFPLPPQRLSHLELADLIQGFQLEVSSLIASCQLWSRLHWAWRRLRRGSGARAWCSSGADDDDDGGRCCRGESVEDPEKPQLKK